MKSKKILTLILVAIATLGASVSAQSVTFMSIKANKAEGVSYSIRAVNANPQDSFKVAVYFSTNGSYSPKWLLKEYISKDSVFIINDSLSGIKYSMPTPPATIHVFANARPDTSKWTSINSGLQKIQLKVRPLKIKMSVVTMPVSTQYGPVTTFSVNSNVPWTMQKFFHFQDSAKTILSGVIEERSFGAMNGTVKDTILGATQNGWVAYRFINEAGDTFTLIMKVSQFVTNAKPWSNITSTVWTGTKWSIDGEATGNNLATTGILNYLEPGATKWKQLNLINFIGQGVEKFHYDLTTTVQGLWQFKMATKNSIGVDTSGTISNTNQSPTTAFSITNGAVTYLSPGKIKVTGNLTLSAGNTAKITTMVANDTLFKTVQISQEVLFTSSGNIEIIFDGILDKGQKYVTFRGMDTKNATWIDRVRPFSKVYISNGADVKPVVIKEGVKIYPNPTTAEQGFTVNCASNKPETLTIFDATGKKVYETTVSDGDTVKSNLSAGLYLCKISNAIVRILID
jgi:hypothetical protein